MAGHTVLRWRLPTRHDNRHIELKHYPFDDTTQPQALWNTVCISYCGVRCVHHSEASLFIFFCSCPNSRPVPQSDRSLLQECFQLALQQPYLFQAALVLCNCGKGLWLCCCSEKWFVPLHHIIVLFSLVQRASEDDSTIWIRWWWKRCCNSTVFLLCGCLHFLLFLPVIFSLLGCYVIMTMEAIMNPFTVCKLTT